MASGEINKSESFEDITDTGKEKGKSVTTSTEVAHSPIRNQFDRSLDTMDGWLDHYDITFEKMARIMATQVFDEGVFDQVKLDELRKWVTLGMKIRGGFKPVDKNWKGEVTYKWAEKGVEK